MIMSDVSSKNKATVQTKKKSKALPIKFSSLEIQCMSQVFQKNNPSTIGELMGLSPRTISYCLSNIIRKSFMLKESN